MRKKKRVSRTEKLSVPLLKADFFVGCCQDNYTGAWSQNASTRAIFENVSLGEKAARSLMAEKNLGHMKQNVHPYLE